MKFRELFEDFMRLFFPETCAVCRRTLVRGEEAICLECVVKMPVTNYHRSPYRNPLLDKLVDVSAPIERATAYFFYKKENPYSSLIQQAKYRNRPRIDYILARDYAQQLLSLGFFSEIDGVVAVPIHWIKHLRRGYNQSHHIACGISEATGIPVVYNLKARKPHKTQTKKSAAERRKGFSEIFEVDNPLQFSGKHLLLVDDVITTGSTILSCARALHRAIPGLRLSVLSLTTTPVNK